MRRLFLTFLALLAFAFPAFAQAKHTFTFEDMMKLKRVGDPQVSPDGKWVIFSVVDVNLEANTKTPHIWIVPTVGGQEREIIGDQDADRPRWSPDGSKIAFVTREGSNYRIAVQDLASGTVSVLSRGSLDESPSFAPNGATIIYAGRDGAIGTLQSVSVDGLVSQRLTSSQGELREPAWEPFQH